MQPRHKNHEDCIKELNLNATNLNECIEGEKGTILQLRAEIDSIKAHLSGVPTVTYNGKPDPNDESLSNFDSVLKSMLKNETYKVKVV